MDFATWAQKRDLATKAQNRLGHMGIKKWTKLHGPKKLTPPSVLKIAIWAKKWTLPHGPKEDTQPNEISSMGPKNGLGRRGPKNEFGLCHMGPKR